MRSTAGPPASCPEEKPSETKLEQSRRSALPSLPPAACVWIYVKNLVRCRWKVLVPESRRPPAEDREIQQSASVHSEPMAVRTLSAAGDLQD